MIDSRKSDQYLDTFAQFEAFVQGLMMLRGGPAIHLFSATDLNRQPEHTASMLLAWSLVTR